MALFTGAGSPPTEPVAFRIGAVLGDRLRLGTKWRYDQMAVTAGHRSFSCSLEAAAEGVLSHATLTGWRFIVLRGGRPLAKATMASGGARDGRVISCALSRKLRYELADLDWLSQRPEVITTDFEICFLRVPGAFIRAWWLISASGRREDDILMPLGRSHSALRADRRTYLRAVPFEQRVADLARRLLAAAPTLLLGALDGDD